MQFAKNLSVILSGVAAVRSTAAAESKDPYSHLNAGFEGAT